MRYWQLALFFFLNLFLAGCSGEGVSRPKYPIRMEIVRAFMHETDSYTFLVNGKENELVLRSVRVVARNETHIFRDVPANEPMWVRYFEADEVCSNIHFCRASNLEIHLHSEEDLNTSGWNHGKYGRGETTVLE